MNTNFFNLSKRKKRDVLYELLTDSQHEGIISNKELNALNRLVGNSAQAEPLQKRKQEKSTKKTARRKKALKRKTTYYLTDEVFENLDNAKKEIQAIVPEKLRSKVSKSQIVNKALSVILKEFEAKGGNSSLVRELVKKN
jgi:hypothetical protein